jgi:uncharacterized damage-inducible protein DinB
MTSSGSVVLEHLAFLARANSTVNLRLGEVLESAPEVWERSLVGYVAHISAILAHIQVADSYWAADIAFSADLPLFAILDAGHLPDYDDLRYTNLEDWRRQHVKQDAVLEALVAGLSPQHLDVAVREFENPEKAGGQPVWKALLHVFSHQTHHRGQVSAALEAFGVEHNFSNLISID